MSSYINSAGLVGSDGSLIYSNQANGIGTYTTVYGNFGVNNPVYGSNYAAGTGTNQLRGAAIFAACGLSINVLPSGNNISGTWKWLSCSTNNPSNAYSLFGLAVRVA